MFYVRSVKPSCGEHRWWEYVLALEPERCLEQLVIERPEYMTRGPIIIPDRDKLLYETLAFGFSVEFYKPDLQAENQLAVHANSGKVSSMERSELICILRG